MPDIDLHDPTRPDFFAQHNGDRGESGRLLCKLFELEKVSLGTHLVDDRGAKIEKPLRPPKEEVKVKEVS